MDFIELAETSEPQKVLALLLPWVEEQNKRYRTKHLEWEKNILFYLGKQWIEKKEGVDGYLIYEDTPDHFYPVTNLTKNT